MTLEDLGNLGELIAAIATLGALIYLAMQIRQNSESVKLSAGQTILTSLNEALQSASSSPQQARVVILGQSDFDNLPEEEQIQFIVWLFGWFRVLEQAHHYNKKGILDEEIWGGHVNHTKQVMKGATAISWWSKRKSFFSSSFQEFIDDMVSSESEAPSPRELMESMRK